MNAPTELSESHHQYKEQKMLLDNNVNGTIRTMNGIKQNMNTTTTTAAERNLAKINWWYTPFKPLTLETVVDQQQQHEQHEDEEQEKSITKFMEPNGHLMELVEDELEENDNPNEQKEEEKDALMLNGKYTYVNDYFNLKIIRISG